MNAQMRYHKLCDDVISQALRCGRDPTSIDIVAVTKGHTAEEIMPLYAAGCRTFGESRLQEALPKIEQLPQGLAWHLIGTLQKNKVAKAIGCFTLIHSIDSLDLALKIAAVSAERKCITKILLQVNTSGEKSKHGFQASDTVVALESLLTLKSIHIEGFMTIAPAEAPTATIATCFAKLRQLRDLCAAAHKLPFPLLSMGMSADYPIAIAEGATLLRVGSALF